MKAVKTFEEACKQLGYNAKLTSFDNAPEKHREAFLAHYVLSALRRQGIRERQLKQLMKLNRITNAWIKNVSLAFAKLLVSCRFFCPTKTKNNEPSKRIQRGKNICLNTRRILL